MLVRSYTKPHALHGTVARNRNGDAILVVADGVSSSINASSAFETAVNVISDILVSCSNPDDAVMTMQRAIESAHRGIMSLPVPTLDKNMGEPETTVVAAFVHGDKIILGWVGDSRAYIVGQDSTELVTIDDSWVEEVVCSGEFTREQALLNKQAHCVTQVLGMRDESVNIHVLQSAVPEGEMVLLCSDGLWNYFQKSGSLSDAVRSCSPQSDALAVCKHLVNIANVSGGHDNIIVALLRK